MIISNYCYYFCFVLDNFFCDFENYFVLKISVQEIQAEGKYAIDSPGSPTAPEIPPEDYTLSNIF